MVKVKPLEWNKYKSLVGYKLCASGPFGNEVGRYDLSMDDLADMDNTAIKSFKEKTQAQYEQKILSVIDPEPTKEMLEAGLREALKFMDENGVDALSPFTDYPRPSETIRRVFIAMVQASKEASPCAG